MYDSLKPFTVKRAHFRCVITNVQLYNMHPYLNYYEGMESILVQDLENLDTGEYIAKFYWLNNNNTFRKLDLQQKQGFTDLDENIASVIIIGAYELLIG